MNCPHCGCPRTSVIDSRPVPDEVKRRRRCLRATCGKRFNTYEISDRRHTDLVEAGARLKRIGAIVRMPT